MCLFQLLLGCNIKLLLQLFFTLPETIVLLSFFFLLPDWGRTCERNTRDTWLILRPIMSLRFRPYGTSSTWETCLRKWRRPTRHWPRGKCLSHSCRHTRTVLIQVPQSPICLSTSLTCSTLWLRRCKQLDKALADATFRIQELEGINSSLEKKLVI